MKKSLAALVLCMAMALTLCGCGTVIADLKPTTSENQSAITSESVETSQPPEPTVEAVSEEPTPDYMIPIDFTWQPYVLSKAFIQAYSDDFPAEFNSMVAAFLAYEGTFGCSSAENAEAINTAAACCFPLLAMDVGRVSYDDEQNVGVLAYVWSEEEHMAGIDRFADTIDQFITSCVMKSDNEVTAAMAMYMTYARMITYDYSALGNEVMADLSSYRGLTQYAGICQTFGPAYAYLCLQLGIDAVSAGSLSTDDTAHEWTLVTLNDLYYYMDTTFENGDGGYGLKYFGMTTADRVSAGNYIEKIINVGGTNLIWGPDITVTDKKFAPLRNAVCAELNREQNQVSYTDNDGKEWTFPLD